MESKVIANRSVAMSAVLGVVVLSIVTGCSRYTTEQRKIVKALQTSFNRVTVGMSRETVTDAMHADARMTKIDGAHVEYRLTKAELAQVEYTLVFGAPLRLDPAFAYYFDDSDQLVAKYRHD